MRRTTARHLVRNVALLPIKPNKNEEKWKVGQILAWSIVHVMKHTVDKALINVEGAFTSIRNPMYKRSRLPVPCPESLTSSRPTVNYKNAL